MTLRAANERAAELITEAVATMPCAYAFGVLALVGLPQALAETFAGGFHPLLLVNWISQSFLQLVLLSVIMVGGKRGSETQTAALMEMLTDMRELHDARHAEVMEKLA